MSERQQRRENADVLAKCLSHLEHEISAETKVRDALVVAHKVLIEEPRTLLPCKFDIEFARHTVTVQRARCSECGEAVLGWEEKWRFCPVCSASITAAGVEVDPRNRMIRDGVKSAMKDIYANG